MFINVSYKDFHWILKGFLMENYGKIEKELRTPMGTFQ